MNQTIRSSDSIDPASAVEPPEFAPPLSPTGPAFLWLAVQIAALIIAAFRIPLWAQAPTGQEVLALKIVAIAQIWASSLLFPMLMKTWQQWMMSIVITWPLIALAGLLAAVDHEAIFSTAAYVTAWLVVLGLIHFALGNFRLRMIGVAAISFWSMGWPFLLFIRQEYGPGAHAALGLDASPIIAVSSDLLHSAPAWESLAVAAFLAGLMLIGQRFFLMRSKGSELDNPREKQQHPV